MSLSSVSSVWRSGGARSRGFALVLPASLAGLCACGMPVDETGANTRPVSLERAAGEPLEPAPEVVIETSYGDLLVVLDAVEMPATCANFLSYVDSDFYAETVIHRVVRDFVIQGGGFEPGRVAKVAGPPIPFERSAAIRHRDGTLSMARSNRPDSATSQWFLVDGRRRDNGPSLDGNYAAFGQLLEGFDVLAAIADVPTDPQSEAPFQDVLVTAARRR